MVGHIVLQDGVTTYFENFDKILKIVHHLGRWHGNVDGLIKACEGVGDVSKNDDFPNVTIMTINVEEGFEEY
jgi:hypothetical protein